MVCALGATGAVSADARQPGAVLLTRCALTRGFPDRTLSVQGMECTAALRVERNLFRDNPRANSIPFRATRTFITHGRTGRRPDITRRFTCTVRYDHGAGTNRGGIQLTVRCRDGHGHSLRYTEQQDNE